MDTEVINDGASPKKADIYARFMEDLKAEAAKIK